METNPDMVTISPPTLACRRRLCAIEANQLRLLDPYGEPSRSRVASAAARDHEGVGTGTTPARVCWGPFGRRLAARRQGLSMVRAPHRVLHPP
jgi:hypothetical protein